MLNTDNTWAPSQRAVHLAFLKDSIFQIKTKWPQFAVMFDQLDAERASIQAAEKVLVLERCYFYGGHSLFRPLFDNPVVHVVDCLNESVEERRGAQGSWVEHSDFLKSGPDFEFNPEELSTELSETYDLVVVPNVVHHVRDQQKLFAGLSKVLKPSGKVMIFEGLVREMHHLPADYIRYTPYGIKFMFESHGISFDSVAYGSGVFDVVAYCMQMALEYFPEDDRERYGLLYNAFLFPFLQELDKKYPTNQQKRDKMFPMSYVTWGSAKQLEPSLAEARSKCTLD